MKLEYLDLSYLDSVAGDDQTVKQRMIEILLEEIPREIVEINESLAVNDLVQASRASHKMGSSLYYLGNQDLIALNKYLGEQTKSVSTPEGLPELATQLDNLLRPALQELNELIKTPHLL